MCRETDETVSEPQFINLSYVQAQHDYLAGNYPVVREDAAQVGLPCAAVQSIDACKWSMYAGSGALQLAVQALRDRHVS